MGSVVGGFEPEEGEQRFELKNKLIRPCPKTISPQSRKGRRERNFIRIPERGILINIFAVFPKGLDS